MRYSIISGLAAVCCRAGIAEATEIVRSGAAEAAIAATVTVPADARLTYVSGTVPDAVDPAAAQGSVERFGDTEAQTRSVLGKIEAVLKGQGLGMGDVVMMRGYKAYFGTAAQPLKPARSTMQVAGLVDPGWLVEIEVTAARK